MPHAFEMSDSRHHVNTLATSVTATALILLVTSVISTNFKMSEIQSSHKEAIEMTAGNLSRSCWEAAAHPALIQTWLV